MPHEVIFLLVVYFGIVGLVCSLILAAAIKYFERALTFRQAFLISAVTNFITLVLFVTYRNVQPQLGVPKQITDMLATLAAMILTATIVTRLSANYGIKKTGWFGLGAKAVFGLYALLLVLTAAIAALVMVFGH